MLKRGFDFTLSLIGLIISAPLWILFSVAIWLEDRRPIFYLQESVGRGGITFRGKWESRQKKF